MLDQIFWVVDNCLSHVLTKMVQQPLLSLWQLRSFFQGFRSQNGFYFQSDVELLGRSRLHKLHSVWKCFFFWGGVSFLVFQLCTLNLSFISRLLCRQAPFWWTLGLLKYMENNEVLCAKVWALSSRISTSTEVPHLVTVDHILAKHSLLD